MVKELMNPAAHPTVHVEHILLTNSRNKANTLHALLKTAAVAVKYMSLEWSTSMSRQL